MILWLVPDLTAHIDSFWPTSAIGWVTFGTLATAGGKTVFDWATGRRKSLSAVQGSIAAVDKKVDELCGKIDDMEGRLDAVDGLARTVGELVFEWRGVDGNNGYKSIIRENTRRITEIEKRNWQIDAVRQEDERRSGGQHRRAMDRAFDEEKDS